MKAMMQREISDKIKTNYKNFLNKIKEKINIDTIDCAFLLVDKDFFYEYITISQEFDPTDLLILATMCGAISPEQSKLLMEYERSLQSGKSNVVLKEEEYIRISEISKNKINIAKEFLSIYKKIKNGTATSNKYICELKNSSKSLIKLAACSSLYDFCYSRKTNSPISAKNIYTLIPQLWDEMVDIDKYKVGDAYYFCYYSGMSSKANILKDILMYVGGLRYIPRYINSKNSNEMNYISKIIYINEYIFSKKETETYYLNFLDRINYPIDNSISWLYITALISVICSTQPKSRELKKILSDKLDEINNDDIKQYKTNILPYYSRILLKILSIQSYDDIYNKMIRKFYFSQERLSERKQASLAEEFNKNMSLVYNNMFINKTSTKCYS